MYAFVLLAPAPPPRAAVMTFTSLMPAKIVTTVALVCTNVISFSMKLPRMVRLYCWPRVWKSRPMTAVGMPRLRLVTLKPCALSARTVTGT